MSNSPSRPMPFVAEHYAGQVDGEDVFVQDEYPTAHDGTVIIAELIGFCEGVPVWCEVEPEDTRLAADILPLDWYLEDDDED